MNYLSESAIDELIRDYRKDFGVCLSFEDAVRMMTLAEMFGEVFEKYADEVGCDDMPAFLSRLLGF